MGLVHVPILFAQHTMFCVCEMFLWGSFIEGSHFPLGEVSILHSIFMPFMIAISWNSLLMC